MLFDDAADVGNLLSVSFAFSKTSLNILKFTVHILLKPGLENFELQEERQPWVAMGGHGNCSGACPVGPAAQGWTPSPPQPSSQQDHAARAPGDSPHVSMPRCSWHQSCCAATWCMQALEVASHRPDGSGFLDDK